MRILGHLIMLVLHAVAICTGFWGLLLTIPLHLIFTVLVSRKPTVIVQQPRPRSGDHA